MGGGRWEVGESSPNAGKVQALWRSGCKAARAQSGNEAEIHLEPPTARRWAKHAKVISIT
jgi:hypothetical protein